MSDPNQKKYIRIRVKFSKHGPVKYVGHLDMMRFFQKVIRRAGLDIRYSEGYSPHQIMSFASPLSVGAESDAEYFDMDMISSPEPDDALLKLNAQCVPGIKVLSYVRLPEGAPKAMAAVYASDYEIKLPGKRLNYAEDTETLNGLIEKYLSNPEIMITKKTKKGEREINIRPLIMKLEALQPNIVFARIRSGSENNLNVKTLAENFSRFCGVYEEDMLFGYTRKEVYYVRETAEGKRLCPLDM